MKKKSPHSLWLRRVDLAAGSDFRVDFTSNWEPICDIDTFERMAAEFNQMVRKFINPEKVEIIIKRNKNE